MSCNCEKCCRNVFRKTTSITSLGNINLIVNNVPSPLTNGQVLKLCIAQCIPEANPPKQVVIVANGTNFALVDNHGNGVYSDQLRSRKVYYLEYATTLNSWVVRRCELCCTKHVFPPVTIPPIDSEVP